MTNSLFSDEMDDYLFFSDGTQHSSVHKPARKQSNGANLGFEEKLWIVADKMRGHMDPAEYKHVALGLVFLKFVSDRFQEHYEDLITQGLSPEDPQNHLSHSRFWVPTEARWMKVQGSLKDRNIGRIIDEAMLAIERENHTLIGVLPSDYARPTLSKQLVSELVEIIGTIGLGSKDAHSQDVIGRVYEYFLGRFAGAEGNKGGEFYTPRSVVKLLVEMIEPFRGKVYDPCCGSAGMFVQSEEFIKEHGGTIDNISIYGQESNPTTWRLAKMNLVIRGMKADLGEHHANTFSEDMHPTLKADFILANPPFNMSYWGGEKLAHDNRWKFGVPQPSNANFAWVQHIISHLSPNGIAGFVLSNGALSSNVSGEGKLRQSLIEADLIDCIVSLPSQLFYGTSIAASLWFISQNKADERYRMRCRETLFIDARKMGCLVDRTHRELSNSDIMQIAGVYRMWRSNSIVEPYVNIPGFCKSANLDEIAEHKWALVPGRYVGFPDNSQVEQDISYLLRELEEVELRLLKVSEASQAALRVLKGLFHGRSIS